MKLILFKIDTIIDTPDARIINIPRGGIVFSDGDTHKWLEQSLQLDFTYNGMFKHVTKQIEFTTFDEKLLNFALVRKETLFNVLAHEEVQIAVASAIKRHLGK